MTSRTDGWQTRLDAAGTPSVRSPVTNLRHYSYTVDHLSFCEAVHDEFLKMYGHQHSSPVRVTKRQRMEAGRLTACCGRR